MASVEYMWIDYARGLGLKGPPQAVALMLSTYANEEGVAWPSIPALSDASGVSERRTSKAVKQLEQLGVLEIERGTGRGNTSRYRFTLAEPTANSPELAALIRTPARPQPGGLVIRGVYDADGNPRHIEIRPFS